MVVLLMTVLGRWYLDIIFLYMVSFLKTMQNGGFHSSLNEDLHQALHMAKFAVVWLVPKSAISEVLLY